MMNNNVLVRTLLAVAAVGAFLGCSTANQAAPKLNPTTGVHPATWVSVDHWGAYLQNPSSCQPCHGSAADPTQAGGTSQVSCFQCHHPNGPNHAAGWSDRGQHGRLGAQAAANSTPFSMQGFASCTPCHGSDYNTPVVSTPTQFTPSCLACHTKAPHPDAPWTTAGLQGASDNASSHDRTDQSNVPECFKCHYYGSAINTAILPVGMSTGPLTAGAAPGCMNGTMCHTNKL